MDLFQNVPARRFEDGRFDPIEDPVIRETRIELDINSGQARLAMLCLPRDLEALTVGFLHGEGVLRRLEDLRSLQVQADERKVQVSGDFDAEALDRLHRRWTWGSGCGGGGTSRDLDQPAYARVAEGTPVPAATLLDLLRGFQNSLDLWRKTGGVHACALADDEAVRLQAEDVGRHNAFDKIMGMALLQKVDVAGRFVLSTGRLSAELVSKAVACGVPMLVSRCAVTALAIDLARKFGMTLVGFARGRRLNVYTGFQRVV